VNPEPSLPRLLIITTTFPRWRDDPGPAPFVFHHARALARRFRVTVLAPHFPGAALEEELDGVLVHRFRYFAPERLELLADGAGLRNHLRQSLGARLLALPLLAAEFLAIRRELRGPGYDFINSHWLVPSGLLAALVAPRRVRHLITVHASDYDLLGRMPLGRLLLRFIALRAHWVVCVSPRFADGIAAATNGRARTVVQPMGADLGRFRFDAAARERWRGELGLRDARLVLFVGKLTAKKGVEVLLAALASAPLAEARLLVVGEGERKGALTARAEQLGIAGRVRFLGAVPNRELAGLYSAADVVAVPSVRDPAGETEGMPVVILEALAAGRPVVATRLCSAPPELVGHGVIEVREESGDELASAIAAALARPPTIDSAALMAYDVDAVAGRYAALLTGPA
jgi:glycosyltransferase involved in cell wall biosynthesis